MELLAENIIPVLCFVNQIKVNSIKRKNIFFKAVKFAEVSLVCVCLFQCFWLEKHEGDSKCYLLPVQSN